jgi:hypothetical protein
VIRRDSQKFCLEYFDKIKEGKLESAYIMTVQPKSRPREDSTLRDEIENRFNPESGRSQQSGLFNMFKEHLLTHVIIQGGKDVVVEPLGVASWEYTGAGGGYVVRDRVRVVTPELSFEGVITIKSTEPQGKSTKGREWSISLPETSNNPTNITPLEDGRPLVGLQRSAGTFISEWQGRLRSMAKADHVEAFLGTLEPTERATTAEKFRKSLPSAAAAMIGSGASDGWSGLTAACGSTLASEENLPGYADFYSGKLVKLVPDFWAPTDTKHPFEEVRDMTLAAARSVFHTTADMPMGVLHVDPGKLAFWSRHGDKIRFRHHMQLRVRTLPTAIEGEIVAECPAGWLTTGPTPEGWRIVEMDLMSLRAIPQIGPAAGGRGPGNMGFGGPGQDQ